MTDTKAEKAEKAEAKAEVKAAAAAATAKPASVAPGSPGDPTDHSIGGGKAAEAAKAAAQAAEVDNTIVGKIRRSELYAVNDHPSGGGWYVGISPQNDPKASEASKRLSSVQPLDTFAPKTGMRVVPKDKEAFVIGEGFGPDATPADWARVTFPDGKPLFT